MLAVLIIFSAAFSLPFYAAAFEKKYVDSDINIYLGNKSDVYIKC